MRNLSGLKAISALKGIGPRWVRFLGERPFRTEPGIQALTIRQVLKELE